MLVILSSPSRLKRNARSDWSDPGLQRHECLPPSNFHWVLELKHQHVNHTFNVLAASFNLLPYFFPVCSRDHSSRQRLSQNTMPIRNPFARREPPQNGQPYEENAPVQNGTRPTFEKVDTVGSKTSSALSISSKQSQEPPEYKMSGMYALCLTRDWGLGLGNHLANG